MKRGMLLFCCCILAMLIGCRNNDNIENTSEKMEIKEELFLEDTDQPEMAESDETEDFNLEESYTNLINIEDNSNEDGGSNQILVYPFLFGDFSEGLAWIKGIRDDTGEEIYVLINEEGNALYVEEDAIYLSDCEDGMTFLRKSGEEGNIFSQVIDKNGQKLFSSEDIENATILGYGNELFIVGKYISGFDVNEVQIGVVDKNGKWISELKSDKFVIDGKCLINNITNGQENTLQYMGEGIFMAHEDFDYIFYNSDDNITYNLNGYWKVMGDYYNGKMLVYNTRDYGYVGVHSLDRFGNLVMIAEGIDGYIAGKYSDGLWYYMGGFYNAEGKKEVDISQYQDQIDITQYGYPIFKDGYSTLVLEGADSNSYYTVINKNGEFMFEPRLLELAYRSIPGDPVIGPKHVTSPGIIKDGLFSIYENGKWAYYNIFGERKIEVNVEVGSYSEITPYNYNIALLKGYGDEIYKFIGKDGEIKLETIIVDKNLLEE